MPGDGAVLGLALLFQSSASLKRFWSILSKANHALIYSAVPGFVEWNQCSGQTTSIIIVIVPIRSTIGNVLPALQKQIISLGKLVQGMNTTLSHSVCRCRTCNFYTDLLDSYQFIADSKSKHICVLIECHPLALHLSQYLHGICNQQRVLH